MKFYSLERTMSFSLILIYFTPRQAPSFQSQSGCFYQSKKRVLLDVWSNRRWWTFCESNNWWCFTRLKKQTLKKLHCPFFPDPMMFVHTDSNLTEDSVAAIPFVPCQWRIVKTAFLLNKFEIEIVTSSISRTFCDGNRPHAPDDWFHKSFSTIHSTGTKDDVETAVSWIASLGSTWRGLRSYPVLIEMISLKYL